MLALNPSRDSSGAMADVQVEERISVVSPRDENELRSASSSDAVPVSRPYSDTKGMTKAQTYSPDAERNETGRVKYEEDTQVDRYTPLATGGGNEGAGNDRDGLSPASENSVASYEWSFEEQFKQLYELDTDTGRKAFLDDYFDFMKRRGTPVSRIPIMAKQILDLYQLYNLVVRHGGLVQVIRNKQWSKVTKGLHLPTSITSAAFTLRTQYLKYLYPYECAMHSLSTPKELQAAIDSNRRDRFSTLYHPEPSMTAQRDDRFPGYPVSAYDFSVVPPNGMHQSPHHHQISAPGVKNEMKYPLKRSIESVVGRGYEKYGSETPKVIILQDGHQAPNDAYVPDKQVSHMTMRSPVGHEMESRKISELEMMRQRVHHMMYNGKDWDGDIRHVIEEEQRMHAHRSPDARMICKEKGCNGVECKYPYPDHREMRRHHGHVVPTVCACNYCTDKVPQHYPSPSSRRESEDYRHQAEVGRGPPVKERLHRLDSSGSGERSPPTPNHRVTSNGSEKGPNSVSPSISTFKARVPEVGRAGNSDQGIFVALEIGGKMYEGFVHPKDGEPIRN